MGEMSWAAASPDPTGQGQQAQRERADRQGRQPLRHGLAAVGQVGADRRQLRDPQRRVPGDVGLGELGDARRVDGQPAEGRDEGQRRRPARHRPPRRARQIRQPLRRTEVQGVVVGQDGEGGQGGPRRRAPCPRRLHQSHEGDRLGGADEQQKGVAARLRRIAQGREPEGQHRRPRQPLRPRQPRRGRERGEERRGERGDQARSPQRPVRQAEHRAPEPDEHVVEGRVHVPVDLLEGRAPGRLRDDAAGPALVEPEGVAALHAQNEDQGGGRDRQGGGEAQPACPGGVLPRCPARFLHRRSIAALGRARQPRGGGASSHGEIMGGIRA